MKCSNNLKWTLAQHQRKNNPVNLTHNDVFAVYRQSCLQKDKNNTIMWRWALLMMAKAGKIRLWLKRKTFSQTTLQWYPSQMCDSEKKTKLWSHLILCIAMLSAETQMSEENHLPICFFLCLSCQLIITRISEDSFGRHFLLLFIDSR